MEEQVMTKEELATFLKVTQRTIDRLRKEGMPFFKVGTNIRFDKEEVLNWLKENEK